MRKVVLLLAALLVLIPVAGADIADEIRTLDGSGNNRNHPDWGKADTQYLRVAPANYADGDRRRRSAGRRRRYVSNRDLQRRRPERLLRERRHPVGLGVGPVPRPHLRAARARRAARRRRSPFDATDPLESFTQRLRRDRRSRARRPRRGTGRRRRPRQQINTVSQLHRRLRASTAAPTHAARLAARGAGRRQPRQQRRDADAARRLPARARDARGDAGDARRRWTSTGALGAAARRRRWSPATCGPTRTSR